MIWLSVNGHPIPDIPVIGSFETDGNSVITVEIDPRCFADDPEEVLFVKSNFDSLTNDEKDQLIQKAKAMVSEAMEVRFGMQDWFLPNFSFTFLEKEVGDLAEENILVVQGTYESYLDSNTSFYQIRSLEDAAYDIVFTNLIQGKPQRRVNVLFPNEESFQLDLSFIDGQPVQKKVPELNQSNLPQETKEDMEKRRSDARSTFFSFTRQRFCSCAAIGIGSYSFRDWTLFPVQKVETYHLSGFGFYPRSYYYARSCNP